MVPSGELAGRAVGIALKVPLMAGPERGNLGGRGGLWLGKELPRVPR